MLQALMGGGGALWNIKYFMENPVRMLQLEERDRSRSEEQRAGSQRTTRTWRC